MKTFLLLVLLISIESCNKETFVMKGTISSRIVHSNIINDNFKIYTYLPPNYNSSSTYQVLFQLDADYQLDNTISEIENLISTNTIKPIIIIGIGYSNGDKRDRDYTISKVSGIQNGSGEASNFYQFLTKELMPDIENKFKTDTVKGHTIIGHSLGGLFVTYGYFMQNTQMKYFKNYIAQSPSLLWDGGKIFTLESNSLNTFSGQFYSNVGLFENSSMISLERELEKRFSNIKYSNSKFLFEYIKDASHTDTKVNNLSSFKFIFKL